MTAQRKTVAAPVVVAAVLLLVMLPILYLAALGPLTRWEVQGRLSKDVLLVIREIYTPVRFAADTFPPFRRALGWYVGLWMPPLSQ